MLDFLILGGCFARRIRLFNTHPKYLTEGHYFPNLVLRFDPHSYLFYLNQIGQSLIMKSSTNIFIILFYFLKADKKHT